MVNELLSYLNLKDINELKNPIYYLKNRELISLGKKIKLYSFHRTPKDSIERKKYILDSILKRYPISTLCFTIENDEIYCIDGNQRLKAILSFYENDYPSLNGKYFKDLSDQYKQAFLDYEVPVFFVKSELEVQEVFIRLNMHIPLNNVTSLNRQYVFNAEIKRLTQHEFFEKHFPKRSQLEGYSILEQLLTSISLVFERENNQTLKVRYKDISLKNLNKFIEEMIEDNKVLDTNRIEKVLDYLNLVSLSLTSIEKRKIYNKVDLIPIIIVIDKLNSFSLNPIKFANKLRDIYSNLENEYGQLRVKNTKSLENNLRRVEILFEQFHALMGPDF